MKIDAHVHVFAKASAAFPREVTDELPADREATVEQLMEEMEANGIDRAVLVQIGGKALEHHRYLEDCLERYPGQFKGIGLIPDPQKPEDHMDRLAEKGGIIGFRLNEIGGPRDPLAPMNVTEFTTYPIWKHAAEEDYVLWLYVNARDAHQIPFLMDAFPELRVVFNHLMVCPGKGQLKRGADGRPHLVGGIPPQTRYNTAGLYQYENVCVKLSGQYAFSEEPYPYTDLANWHQRLVSTFGADHCMWATDFPWIVDEPGYGKLVKVLDELLPDLTEEERGLVMGGAAQQMLWGEDVAASGAGERKGFIGTDDRTN